MVSWKHVALALILVLLPGAVRAQFLWWADYRLQAESDLARDTKDVYADQLLTGHCLFPLYDFRLGAVQLGAGVADLAERFQGPGFSRRGSWLGLGHEDVTVSLFPYRRFPLTLYYVDDRREGVAGSPAWETSREGARLLIQTDRWGRWWFNYEISNYKQGARSELRRWWKINQNKTFGNVSTVFQWDGTERRYEHEERTTFQWGDYYVTARLKGEDYLTSRTNLQLSSYGASSTNVAEEDVAWSSTLTSALHLFLSGTLAAARGGSGSGRSATGAANLFENIGQWRLFGGASYSIQDFNQALSGQEHLSRYELFTGASLVEPAGWTFTLDAALGTDASLSGQQATFETYHASVAKGLTIPEWASHLVYAFKDASFQRRVEALYPPGYLPPELQLLRAQHYLSTRGGQGDFVADFYHDKGGEGRTADQLNVLGDISIGPRLTLNVQGNWNRERGEVWGGVESRSLVLNTLYSSRGGITAGLQLAYSSASVSGPGQGGVHPLDLRQEIYSVGVSFSASLFNSIPVSASIYSSRTALGPSYFQAFLTTQFTLRDLTFHLLYSYDRADQVETGLRSRPSQYRHRIRVDLLRLFHGNT